MPIIIENKLITLNSTYATKLNGTLNSNVIFNFKGILTEESDIVSSNLCIMNAQIPVSFYTINATNNQIQTQIGNVNLVNGNYNFNSLATMTISAFATQIGTNINLTINVINGIITFTYLSGNFPLYLYFDSLYSAYKIFGFNKNQTYIWASNLIIAPYPLNLLGVKKIYIRSQKLQIASFNSATNNLGITLATIPVDVPAFSMISYTNSTDLNKTNLQTKIIDLIDISITDEDNQLIDFNNLDWNITLVLENVRLIPEPAPTFRELVTEVKPFQPLLNEQQIINEEPINDIKDLELLSA